MRISKTAISAIMLATLSMVSAAQAPGTAVPAAPVVAPSVVLAPGLDAVQSTLNTVKTDRWKRGTVRDEASADIGSIVSDIQVKLPPLLKDADAAPGTVSKTIPVARNVDALYDVLLRVVEASRVAAPDDQVVQLQQALVTLGNARLALSDRLQNSAVALEKQVADLQKIVQSQAANIAISSAPIVIPCATPQPRKTTKKPVTRKPAAKPATPSSSTQQTH